MISGATYLLDVLFDEVPLAIELDGREFHGVDRFEMDRERDDHLVSVGLHVLHFTWAMVVEQPEWVLATVRGTLRRLGAAATQKSATRAAAADYFRRSRDGTR